MLPFHQWWPRLHIRAAPTISKLLQASIRVGFWFGNKCGIYGFSIWGVRFLCGILCALPTLPFAILKLHVPIGNNRPLVTHPCINECITLQSILTLMIPMGVIVHLSLDHSGGCDQDSTHYYDSLFGNIGAIYLKHCEYRPALYLFNIFSAKIGRILRKKYFEWYSPTASCIYIHI